MGESPEGGANQSMNPGSSMIDIEEHHMLLDKKESKKNLQHTNTNNVKSSDI